MPRQAFAGIALTCLGAWGSNSCAQEAVPAANWAVQAQLGQSSYKAAEYSPGGAQLNRESGRLLYKSVSLQRSVEQLQWRMTFEQASDTVPYDGKTQAGAPLQTNSRIQISNASADLAWAFARGPHMQWAASAGMGWQQIDRLILAAPPAPPALPAGSQPLRETLDSWLLQLGVRNRWDPFEHSRWHLLSEAQWRSSVRNRMKVNSFGVFEPLTLTPARSSGWRLQMQAQYDWHPNTELGIQWRRDQFTPGSSASRTAFKNGIPVAQVQYPGSRQYQSTLALQIQRRF